MSPPLPPTPNTLGILLRSSMTRSPRGTLRKHGLFGVRLTGFLFALALASGSLSAETKRLRIVGGLATVNQYTRQEEPFWTKDLSRLTKGQLTAEIVPFDKAGIRGEEMLRLMQLGVIPFGTVPVGSAAAQEPLLTGADLAGLNPDFDSVRKSVKAYRPVFEKTLRDKYGIELLAVYVYPAQILFCKTPVNSLADLAERRVRTSTAHQADFVEALKGVSVRTGFGEIIANVKSGNVDCVVTGSTSGNTIELPELTGHLYTMAFSWGISIFGANIGAWNELPENTRATLRQVLPQLEQSIWDEAQRESSDGIACNTNSSSCIQGRRYSMTAVTPSRADDAQRRALFANKVLPRWLLRCGMGCAEAWNAHMAPVIGIKAR